MKRKKRLYVLDACMILLISIPALARQPDYVFRGGDDGYQCFRIPAIVVTNAGTLLAFAEGRKNGCGDSGDIDLVLKRSYDGGTTWSDLVVVWDDGLNTCGNPAPVVDQKTGRIILLSTWNLGTDHEFQIIDGTSKDTRRIFVLVSSDDGTSWSSPREITGDVKDPSWTWYATGPCNGIQMRSGKYRGRLIIPCDHIEAASKKYYSHIIYSDDGGMSWLPGGTTPADKVNECTVAELPGGKLLLNMRNYNPVRVRQTSVSSDGGMTWSDLRGDTALIEPVCQASLLRYNYRCHRSFLAFSNPASQTSRKNMTIRISKDQGMTWLLKKVVYEGPSAYSNLVNIPDGKIGCLFEAGIINPYEGIVFRKLSFSDFR